MRGAKRVADVDVAVADCEDFVLAVDVGDLVNKAVLFRIAKDLHSLVVGDVAAFAGFAAVVRHIADTYTPFFTTVAAAFAEFGSAVTARADTYAEVSLILFEPVGNMLDVHSAVFHLDCFFDGDNVHTDACASRGHHRGDHSQGKIGHTLEEHCKFGMFVKLLLDHIRKFGRAGNEHRKHVATFSLCALDRTVLVIVIAVIVFDDTDVAHFVENLLEVFRFFVLRIEFPKLLEGVRSAHFHRKRNVCHLIGHNATKSPVFGIVDCYAQKFVVDAVGDFPCQFEDFLTRIGIAHKFRLECFAHLSHCCFLL